MKCGQLSSLTSIENSDKNMTTLDTTSILSSRFIAGINNTMNIIFEIGKILVCIPHFVVR